MSDPPVPGVLLAPPQQLSMVDLAFEAIAEAVYDCRLVPGQRLAIDDLARQLGMSVTPVREALSRAAALELVSLDAHRGYTVAATPSAEELHQFFAVRRSLELDGLREAAPWLADASERPEVASALSRLRSSGQAKDINDFRRGDEAFHRALLAVSHNRIRLRAWDGLYFHLMVHRLYVGMGVFDYDEAGEEHEAIWQAVSSGDVEHLIQVSALHIDHAERRLTLLLEKVPHHDFEAR